MVRKFAAASPKEEKVAYWSEVEAKIRSLLESLAGQVSKTRRENALKWLDHNELGLALESICFDLDTDKVAISRSQMAMFDELFDQMDYQDRTLQRKMRTLTTSA